MKLGIAGVEQMFRHKNLVEAGGGPAPNSDPKKREQDRLDQPDKCPDVECLGAGAGSNVNFVFLHGYNVNPQQARGWHAEMFKRMYWSGSKAKFWGVTWYGSDTQILFGAATANYHINVQHASATAPSLANFLSTQVQGDITIAAHSLGNMVVSSMLTDMAEFWNDSYTSGNIRINNYFMIDAAVAMEAYDKDTEQTRDPSSPVNSQNQHMRYMDHQDWAGRGYNDFLFASEWFSLFSPDDARSKLTWRDRFRNRPANTNYYNFYSSGEQVLGTLPYNTSSFSAVLDLILQSGQYAWATQERLKGRLPLGWMIGSNYGGWGFNSEWNIKDPNSIDPDGTINKPSEDANRIEQSELKSKPFFMKGSQDNDLFTDSYLGVGIINSERQSRLIAEAIPALTLPMGANETSALPPTNNINMQDRFKTHGFWPRTNSDWLHSDVREVSYLYLHNLFKKIIDDGGLH